MAEYKVLQDIEAEDKLLGPLSMRQFIYAVIVVVLGFVAYRLFLVGWFLAIPFLPPIIFFGLLAAPLGGQQSSEVWMLAKIRFFVFPRKRVWDQDGTQQLVTITAPKAEEKHLTKEFSQEEVSSRLKALASTLDTRGWAVKNSDRLLTPAVMPQEVPTVDVKMSEDVLDPNGNPVAQQMEAMIEHSEQEHRQELMDKVHRLAAQQKAMPTVAPTPQYPRQPTMVATPAMQTSIPQATPTTPPVTAPTQEPAGTQALTAPTPVVDLAQNLPQNVVNKKAQASMTASGKPAILEDVKQGSQKQSDIPLHKVDDDTAPDEVVVSLH